jgi:hypothetical protein
VDVFPGLVSVSVISISKLIYVSSFFNLVVSIRSG